MLSEYQINAENKRNKNWVINLQKSITGTSGFWLTARFCRQRPSELGPEPARMKPL
jgi:hypothetical protein